MSLYKYVKFKDLIHILEGSIRFTQPGAFNDPFEMVPELYVPEKYGTQDFDIDIKFALTAPRREPRIGDLDTAFESDYCSDRKFETDFSLAEPRYWNSLFVTKWFILVDVVSLRRRLFWCGYRSRRVP